MLSLGVSFQRVKSYAALWYDVCLASVLYISVLHVIRNEEGLVMYVKVYFPVPKEADLSPRVM